MRTLLLEFVSRDFAARRPIAQQWLAEEWTCDRARHKAGDTARYYDTWLDRVLEAQVRAHVDEAALHTFLEELPELPEESQDLYVRIAQAFGAESAGERAAAVELALEWLFLAQKISKDADDDGTIYG